MNGLRRLVAGAMARDLSAFVVPGPDVARARGLDLADAGLRIAASPRHANLLLIAGDLPPGLADAATVAYAQMPRPRAILALGGREISPLPAADATGAQSQSGLVEGVKELRRIIATGAFASERSDFDAPALGIRIEYTCPMHPEVISDQPGNCPKCGMTLVERETSAPGHAGHGAGMPPPEADHGAQTHSAQGGHAGHAAPEIDPQGPARFTCPMHPEVTSNAPGSCPKCGMHLVPLVTEDAQEHGRHGAHHQHVDHAGDARHAAHAGHDMQSGRSGHKHGHAGHGGHAAPQIAGIEANFMSMVDLTRDQPASPDGLKMEWITAPFGPFFPGMPGGLGLTLTLDGDSVVEARAQTLVGTGLGDGQPPHALIDRLAEASPLAPVAMRQMACLAIEAAMGRDIPTDRASARAAAVERERIASHLNWLTGFARQTGLSGMARRADALQRALRHADTAAIADRAGAVRKFLHRVRTTPLLRAKLAGIGKTPGQMAAAGPVGRAAGHADDARSGDPVYERLGFQVVTQSAGDALARLHQRLEEVGQSLDLIAHAGAIELPAPADTGTASGHGMAAVETPRGKATLDLTLDAGRITAAQVTTPFAGHTALIAPLTRQRELADALTAIGSLDLDPWEAAP